MGQSAKGPGKPVWRRKFREIALALVIGLPLCFWLVLAVLQQVDGAAVAFDPEGWRSGSRVTRARMMVHPSFSEATVGLSESDLLDLLGSPDTYVPMPDQRSRTMISYDTRHPWHIGKTMLSIRLDDAGRVDTLWTVDDEWGASSDLVPLKVRGPRG